MADIMYMDDEDSYTVSFSPSDGYEIPNYYNAVRVQTLSGANYKYTYATRRRWEIPLQHISASNASIFNYWRNAGSYLAFYPDYLHDTSTLYYVQIINDKNPFEEMSGRGWEKFFDGDLILEDFGDY